jgi:hypothetical protein
MWHPGLIQLQRGTLVVPENHLKINQQRDWPVLGLTAVFALRSVSHASSSPSQVTGRNRGSAWRHAPGPHRFQGLRMVPSRGIVRAAWDFCSFGSRPLDPKISPVTQLTSHWALNTRPGASALVAGSARCCYVWQLNSRVSQPGSGMGLVKRSLPPKVWRNVAGLTQKGPALPSTLKHKPVESHQIDMLHQTATSPFSRKKYRKEKGAREPNPGESPVPSYPRASRAALQSPGLYRIQISYPGRPMLMQDTALRTLFRKSILRFACLAPPNTTARCPASPVHCQAVHSFQLTLSRSLFPTIRFHFSGDLTPSSRLTDPVFPVSISRVTCDTRGPTATGLLGSSPVNCWAAGRTPATSTCFLSLSVTATTSTPPLSFPHRRRDAREAHEQPGLLSIAHTTERDDRERAPRPRRA